MWPEGGRVDQNAQFTIYFVKSVGELQGSVIGGGAVVLDTGTDMCWQSTRVA